MRLAIVLAALAIGCATYPPVVLRAAQDFGCSENDIQTRDLGNGGWRAEGCDQMGVYDCQSSAGGETIRVRQ